MKRIDEIVDRVLEGYVQDEYDSPMDAYEDGDMFSYMNMVINDNLGKLKVGKWEAEEDYDMGTWMWWKPENEDFIVYITPFFDRKKGIDWQVIDNSSGVTESPDEGVVNFRPTGNPDRDFKSYMNIVKKILSKFK